MDIGKFFEPGKNMVIELDDGVEYVVGDHAVEAIQRHDAEVDLVRLYDGETRTVAIERIQDALLKKSAVDYLDKKL